MEYLEFFGLKEDPFRITPDVMFYYPSATHNDAKVAFTYMLQYREGFFVCTGEPGTGKTITLKSILKDEKILQDANIALILTPRLQPEEFLQVLVEELGMTVNTTNKNELLRAFREHLIAQNQADKKVVIIVDEAQNLPDDTLEELRLLSNLETDKEKLLQIVLVGQPELEQRLQLDKFRQLNQRITLRANLRPFNYEETSDFISHRLTIAGRGNVQFPDETRRLIFKLSNGIARVINLLCSRALMAAYLENSRVVKPEHVNIAAKHLWQNNSPVKPQKAQKLLQRRHILIVVFVCLLAVYVSINIYHWLSVKPEITKVDIPLPTPTITPVSMTQTKQEEKDERGSLNHDTLKETKETTSRAIVVSNSVNLREAPNVEAKKVGRLVQNQEIVVIKTKKDETNRLWAYIKTEGGSEGWVVTSSIREIK